MLPFSTDILFWVGGPVTTVVQLLQTGLVDMSALGNGDVLLI